MVARPAIALLALLSVAACGETVSTTPPPTAAASWTEVKGDALSDAQKAQRAKADGAREALFGKLMGRLTEVMTKDGPAKAVDVCRAEAHPLAAAVAKEQGVAIGRTSHRLRNPLNAPPDWARPLVDARRDTPAFLAAADGRLAVLAPIRLKATCLLCHGDPAKLDPAVKAALATGYPNDQATGFAEGDLRGWFWIEVPKP